MKSHVIPKFVGRWIKETSITPYLRFLGNMDERRQDLFTMELLCDDCENLFSAWERKFAAEVFYPAADGETVFRYGPWFVKFAASLAWRAMQFLKCQATYDPTTLTSTVTDMELHLSRFLLGQEKHVGSYTQHVYPVSELAAPVHPGSPMLNRYLARAVCIGILRNDDLSEIVVYVKLPMFMFFPWESPSTGSGWRRAESKSQACCNRSTMFCMKVCCIISWNSPTRWGILWTLCRQNRRQQLTVRSRKP